MMWEVERIRQRGRPKKAWWDCVKNDMESLGLSKRMHSSGINGEGELRGQPANPGSPGKWPLKRSVCATRDEMVLSFVELRVVSQGDEVYLKPGGTEDDDDDDDTEAQRLSQDEGEVSRHQHTIRNVI